MTVSIGWRRSGAALLLFGAIGSVGLWLTVRSSGGASVPDVPTASLERAVVATITAARAAVVADQASSAAWGHYGQVLHAHGLTEAAVACYDQAARLAGDDFRWPYLAGQALRASQPNAAIARFEAAARADSNNPQLALALADALLDAGRSDAASLAFARVPDTSPIAAFARLGEARIADSGGHLDAARVLLERAAALAPTNGAVQSLAASVYGRLGDAEAAARAALRSRMLGTTQQPTDIVMAAMQALGASATHHAQRGMRLAAGGELAEAEAALRLALAARPPQARDYANLATVLSQQQRHTEALALFEQALALPPVTAETLSNHGMVLLGAGQVDAARNAFLRALAANPQTAPAHFNLGVITQQNGEVAAAVSHYEKAIAADPALHAAWLNLGTAQAASGDLAAALSTWRQLATVRPADVTLHHHMAVAASRLGDHAAAISSLEQALGHAADDARLLAALAYELVTAPRPELRDGARALEIASRLHRTRPRDLAITELLAAAHAERGDFAAAIATAEAAQALAAADPGHGRRLDAQLARYRRGIPLRETTAGEQSASPDSAAAPAPR